MDTDQWFSELRYMVYVIKIIYSNHVLQNKITKFL